MKNTNKPNEQDLMAYLYGELEGSEKEKVERYLLENPNARKELENFQQLRKGLGSIKDKEVIAPPIFVGEPKQRWIWHTPYFKTIISIAASLLIIILAGKFAGTRVSLSGNEIRIGFGEENQPPHEVSPLNNSLTATQVQQMINQSLENNNGAIQAHWESSQEKLDASIRNTLTANSGKIDQLMREASSASREQIQQFATTLQAENAQLVKNYLQLNSSDQKQYIESLLVDFAKYLQQQRKDDLQLVQVRLNSLEQNTNVLRQETEQILPSIISTVGNTATTSREVKY